MSSSFESQYSNIEVERTSVKEQTLSRRNLLKKVAGSFALFALGGELTACGDNDSEELVNEIRPKSDIRSAIEADMNGHATEISQVEVAPIQPSRQELIAIIDSMEQDEDLYKNNIINKNYLPKSLAAQRDFVL